MSTSSPSSPVRPRRLGVVALVVCVAWGVVIAYVGNASLPDNPIDLPFEDQKALRRVVPQGWAFFTRNPRESSRRTFVRTDGRWTRVDQNAIVQPKYAFGLDRKPRAQGPEIALLTDRINDDAWQECKDAPRTCLSEASVAATLSNPSPEPTLCGTVGLALQEPLPWAWRESRSDIDMPSQILKLNVTCE